MLINSNELLKVYKSLKSANNYSLVKIPENKDEDREVVDGGSEYKYYYYY